MKRRILPILIISSVICILCLIPLTNAQDFDSISHPDDFSVKEDEYAIITWEVTISSVVDPRYDVYTDGELYIDNFLWELDGGTGSISINVNTSVAPGDYTYLIFVRDGDGHEISDGVKVTIVGKTGFVLWFERNWLYVVFIPLLVGMVVAMVFVRRKGFKKGASILP